MGFEAAVGFDLNLCTRRSVEAIGIGNEGRTKLPELVSMLEMERSKIEAFKRELPLCMRLVEDVLEYVKEELNRRCAGEFSSIGNDDRREKMSWLSAARLWVGHSNHTDSNNSGRNEKMGYGEEEGGAEADRRREESNPHLESQAPPKAGEKAAMIGQGPLPVTGQVVADGRSFGGTSYNAIGGVAVASLVADTAHLVLQPRQTQSKKARRSWSPELHRLFLAALQRLGGGQAATPKQIMELMKVDGLTNDEVKSHLQKYRLHTRRMPSPG